MIRAASKSDVLLSGLSRPLDFLICAMCSRAATSIAGISMSIIGNYNRPVLGSGDCGRILALYLYVPGPVGSQPSVKSNKMGCTAPRSSVRQRGYQGCAQFNSCKRSIKIFTKKLEKLKKLKIS